ncbi:hypothetical protein [Arthrobacter sp. NPDC090010]|uniref:hypothetical protein n=1 Tax=Arthrobacter sp. NPDC090010 TaxID=3363942 RepID=UPI0037F2201D
MAEAAKLAKVSESTFCFWIERGESRIERSPGRRMRVGESETRCLRARLDGEDVEPSRMPRDAAMPISNQDVSPAGRLLSRGRFRVRSRWPH